MYLEFECVLHIQSNLIDNLIVRYDLVLLALSNWPWFPEVFEAYHTNELDILDRKILEIHSSRYSIFQIYKNGLPVGIENVIMSNKQAVIMNFIIVFVVVVIVRIKSDLRCNKK